MEGEGGESSGSSTRSRQISDDLVLPRKAPSSFALRVLFLFDAQEAVIVAGPTMLA